MENQNGGNPSNTDFFLDSKFNSPQGGTFLQKLKKMWDGAAYYLRQIWPYVNQLITFLVYQITTVVKAIIKIALQQTGLMKE